MRSPLAPRGLYAIASLVTKWPGRRRGPSDLGGKCQRPKATLAFKSSFSHVDMAILRLSLPIFIKKYR